MRTAAIPSLASPLLIAHRARAFDIYLNEESDCPDDEISIVCEDQDVGDCCNGEVNALCSSARASDDQGGVALYGLDQGQPADDANRCGLQLAQDDSCATSDIPPQGSAGGGGGGDEDQTSTDEEPTDGGEGGEDDGGGDHSRRRARSLSPAAEGETWVGKNKRAKRAGGWRQTQHTAYAVRDATHVYKLSRDSPHSAAYRSLTDRQERVDFLKRHGVAKRR